jgi:hypothetical protein
MVREAQPCCAPLHEAALTRFDQLDCSTKRRLSFYTGRASADRVLQNPRHRLPPPGSGRSAAAIPRSPRRAGWSANSDSDSSPALPESSALGLKPASALTAGPSLAGMVETILPNAGIGLAGRHQPPTGETAAAERSCVAAFRIPRSDHRQSARQCVVSADPASISAPAVPWRPRSNARP